MSRTFFRRIWPWGGAREDTGHDPVSTDQVLLELVAWLHRDRKAHQRRRAMGLATLALLAMLLVAGLSGVNLGNLLESAEDADKPLFGVVKIEGAIGGTDGADPGRTVAAMRKAFEHDDVVRVVLSIDSPGGSPHSADRIAMGLERLREEYPDTPVDAVIHTAGASAAYMIAVHADRVIAGTYSRVGSIGAKMTGWDLHKLAERWDVNQTVYASGALKDMGNPFQAPDEIEQRKAQQLVDVVANAFADDVLAQRGEKIALSREALTTGEIWLGREALALGLVDETGTMERLLEDNNARAERLLQPLAKTLSSAIRTLGTGVPVLEAGW